MKTITGIRITISSLYIAVASAGLMIWGPSPVVMVYLAVVALTFYLLYLSVAPGVDRMEDLPNSYRFWLLQLVILCVLSLAAILTYLKDSS